MSCPEEEAGEGSLGEGSLGEADWGKVAQEGRGMGKVAQRKLKLA